MTVNKTIVLTYAVFIFGLQAILAQDITGLWLNEEKTGGIKVLIEKDGSLSGSGSALPGGEIRYDTENLDPKLKGRSLDGAKILWGFKSDNASQTKWSGGKIYDPDSGKTYSCKIRLSGNKLFVRGYVGTPLLGRTTVWTRYISNN